MLCATFISDVDGVAMAMAMVRFGVNADERISISRQASTEASDRAFIIGERTRARGKPRQLNLLHPHKLRCHFAILDDYLIGGVAVVLAIYHTGAQTETKCTQFAIDTRTRTRTHIYSQKETRIDNKQWTNEPHGHTECRSHAHKFHLHEFLLRSKLNDDDVFQPITLILLLFAFVCVCVCVFLFWAPLIDAVRRGENEGRISPQSIEANEPSNDLTEFCFLRVERQWSRMEIRTQLIFRSSRRPRRHRRRCRRQLMSVMQQNRRNNNNKN